MQANEALELVDRVVSDFRGTRQDHINLQQAMSVLRLALSQPKSEPAQDAEPEGTKKSKN